MARRAEDTAGDRCIKTVEEALQRRDIETVALFAPRAGVEDGDAVYFSASRGRVWPLALRLHRTHCQLVVYDVGEDGIMRSESTDFDVQTEGSYLDPEQVGVMVDALLVHMNPVLDVTHILAWAKLPPEEGTHCT